ncbi:MAG: mandelate racemase/muconate lactonizing enzyme family protein [Solirubrobacteraceae bacterium]
MKLELRRRTLRLRAPWETAFGSLRERDVIEVLLGTADGPSGRGEAAPLEPYDGVSAERALATLERYRPAIEHDGADPPGDEAHRGATPGAAAALLERCRDIDPLPQAIAAIDMALWDLAGQREGKPVAELLVDDPAAAVPLSAAIATTDRARAAAEAADAAAAGFRCAKVKVAIGDDGGRLAAVRAAAGPHMALRLDANGRWNVTQAIAAIDALSAVGLELVEEPVRGLAAIRAVREAVSTRVAIDETAAEPGALASGAADAVCLKISRCGGISGLLAAAALVRASGAEVYLGSTLDGPLGIAAAVHAAAALAARGPLPASGLGTLSLFEPDRDTAENQLTVAHGSITTPTGPGLLGAGV